MDESDELIDADAAAVAPVEEINEAIDALDEDDDNVVPQAPSSSASGAEASAKAEGGPADQCEVCASDDEAQETRRAKARYKGHLLDHTEFNPECPGCQAKARNKKHFKGSSDRNNPGYRMMVSMDQVSRVDFGN